MIELHYRDAYKVARKQEFDSLDEALLAFSGCATLPDYYPIDAILQDGKDLNYTGTIGGVYAFLRKIQEKQN